MMEQTITGGSATSNNSVIVQGNQSQQQQPQQQNQDDSINLSGSASSTPQHTSLTESTRLSQGQPSATASPVLSPQGKTCGRNFNGTMVVTSTPTNEAELQLYRVLQRASLLAYYDTLLEMGGDDVQQLCDAGEEEFLEIMALVGMASKPLHVRRLQKSLHEWVNNPSVFQSPLPNIDIPRMVYSPEPAIQPSATSISSRNPFAQGLTSSSSSSSITYTPLYQQITSTNPTSFNQLSSSTNTILPSSSTTAQLTPTLSDIQIKRLITSAERLARQLPHYEPKPQNSKKRSARELEQVMAMSESDPRRMDEIRKYAAIYGRFDCKRRPEKPLTLHEVCVNEAAAQICKYVPALLTRRDELFPLARQVVRDSGFGHSAGIARFNLGQNLNRNNSNINDNNDNETTSTSNINTTNLAKRSRLSSDTSSDLGKDIDEPRTSSLLSIYQRVGKHFDISDTSKFAYSKSEFDDADSRFSFSSSNSPSQAGNGMENDSLLLESPTNGKLDHHDLMQSNLRSRTPDSFNPIGVQIISSSGGHIIAVANPALALSPALSETLATVKRETISPDILR